METIPFFNLPAFSERITLDGVAYNFSFSWNTRGEYWNLAISDYENTPLVSSIKIVLDYELIEQYVDKGLPPGKLYALDFSGNKSDITYEDMTNDRVHLIYLSEGETLESITEGLE